jgi:DNA-binding NarL/FixJ family response regulator
MSNYATFSHDEILDEPQSFRGVLNTPSIDFANGLPKQKESGKLSFREEEVIKQLAEGYVTKEVADHLGLGFETVRTYIKRIYIKLNVHSRGGAVAKWLSLDSALG